MATKTVHGSASVHFQTNIKRGLSASVSLLAMSLMALPAHAQDTQNDDTIVVTGSRKVQQDSIALKRQSTQIVDGLTADDIGDIPALSIGEALENLTGVTSHRENGGATEISIRGLGPFLSTTVFNGREATNGSGNRAVNFSQFPAELLNKAAVFKTQDASLIEGAVAGQVLLETLRPLDHGKQRFQFEVKGNINPDQLNIDDSEAGDFGYRGSASYVDQFELGGGAEIGISIGAEISDISQPEQEIRSTSPQSTSNLACLVGSGFGQGFTNDDIGDDDCEDNRIGSDGQSDGFQTAIDPDTGVAINNDDPFALVGSQSGFRANDTEDRRNALFGAIQFQPNERLDINLDVQWSERIQQEERNDLNFDNRRRNSGSVTVGGLTQSSLDSLVVLPTGEIQTIAQQTDISIGGELFERDEQYIGGGLAVDYELTDRLTASADVSYSRTDRTELQTAFRLQTEDRINTIFSVAETGFPQYTLGLTDEGEFFDITDAASFLDNPRLRVDNDLDRTDEILAGRLDFNYKWKDGSFIDSVDIGARWSERDFFDLSSSAGGAGTGDHRLELEPDRAPDSGNDNPFELTDDQEDEILANIQSCATDFPESDFLTGIFGSNNVITTLDANGNVVEGSTGNTFATLDNNCVNEAILSGFGFEGSNLNDIDFPELAVGITTTDVTERTLAGYVKANFDTTFNDLPLSGNFGVRVVNTDTTSIGFRAAQNILDQGDGTFTVETDNDTLVADEVSSSYTEVLPSINANLEVNDNVIVRGAVFRGISRFRPLDLNNRRTLNFEADDGGDGFQSAEELFATATAFGTPQADPFTSWNYDAAVEWYPNADSIVAFGLYAKQFSGGVQTVTTTEDFVIDGENVTLPINIQQVNDDRSNLYGFEMSLAHRFSYLPGYLSGLGAKVGYNYATSDFEFEDQTFGDAGIVDEDGEFILTNQGILAPAGIPGLSEHVVTAQVNYQIGNFDISGIYKYRDDYFQQFTTNPNVLRFVQGRGLVEARASYKINKNFSLKAEALNILNNERVDTFRTRDNFGQALSFGPRIFFGVRGKF